MSTKVSTINYILEQLHSLQRVSARKMFGEYALYCGQKVVGLVCDDQFFVKYTDPGVVFAQGRFTPGFAYPGARESMNVTSEIDDADFLCTLVRLTADALPAVKKKK